MGVAESACHETGDRNPSLDPRRVFDMIGFLEFSVSVRVDSKEGYGKIRDLAAENVVGAVVEGR